VGNVTSETMAVLLRYDWPGNFRELENGIEKSSRGHSLFTQLIEFQTGRLLPFPVSD